MSYSILFTEINFYRDSKKLKYIIEIGLFRKIHLIYKQVSKCLLVCLQAAPSAAPLGVNSAAQDQHVPPAAPKEPKKDEKKVNYKIY